MTRPTDAVQIRDPFVVPMPEERRYYLFGSTDPNIWGAGTGFDFYVGTDLKHWDGPFPAFRPSPAFWADENFWAPEVYRYQGRYYMFATFKAKGGRRGTGVLAADSIRGPYVPVSQGAVTPADWDALDGTLYVDDNGTPWMIFCHEWAQIRDGEICLMRLSPDLCRADGPALPLFRGSDGPWATPKRNKIYPLNEPAYVTDGPFVYRSAHGTLIMLWSSFRDERYALGYAASPSGRITGPWIQEKLPLFAADGGHGMLFRTFKGELCLALHQPNQTPNERPVFVPVREEQGVIRVASGRE